MSREMFGSENWGSPNMDIRETEGSKGSFNDPIPQTEFGEALFYPGKN